jgi:methylmalonyl-CoA/ethylmalonyl-CoA epimerase
MDVRGEEAIMIIRIGHLALAVRKIERIVESLCAALGQAPVQVRHLPERKVKVALVEIGGFQIEILEDLSKDGFISRHTADHGNSIHHFCLLSDDLEQDLTALKQQGIPLIDEAPRMGVRGKRIAFISPELLDGIPIEISEP